MVGKGMRQYQTACAVFVHAAGTALLGIDLLVVVPKWLEFWSHMTWGMEVPRPLIFIASASNILRNFKFVAIPVILFLLLLDARIYSGLLHRKGEFAAALWADGEKGRKRPRCSDRLSMTTGGVPRTGLHLFDQFVTAYSRGEFLMNGV
jgi:hypothetical protein